MTLLRISAAAAAIVLLASCASRREAPAPAPVRTPVPIQRPVTPPPQPVVPDAAWIDAPLAPGDWVQEGNEARFGPAGAPSFTVRCAAPGQVVLTRSGPVAAAGAITIRTSSTSRNVAARAAPGGGVEAMLPASDPLLDAMFYSRGRYSVEVAGSPRLIVPSWPEPARVVEDCRG